MIFEFDKMEDGDFEVVLDNSLIEYFIRKFPTAQRSVTRSVWTIITPRLDNTNKQMLMDYMYDAQNQRIQYSSDEEVPLEYYVVDENYEVCVHHSIVNEFLTAVTCANFSRKQSAWRLIHGSGDASLKKLEKFKWFAEE